MPRRVKFLRSLLNSGGEGGEKVRKIALHFTRAKEESSRKRADNKGKHSRAKQTTKNGVKKFASFADLFRLSCSSLTGQCVRVCDSVKLPSLKAYFFFTTENNLGLVRVFVSSQRVHFVCPWWFIYWLFNKNKRQSYQNVMV